MANQQNQVILDWSDYFIIRDMVWKEVILFKKKKKKDIFGLKSSFQNEKKSKPKPKKPSKPHHKIIWFLSKWEKEKKQASLNSKPVIWRSSCSSRERVNVPYGVSTDLHITLKRNLAQVFFW